MLSILLDVVMFASFILLLALVWRVSRRPRWRMRAVIYGWALSIILAGLWALVLPVFCRGVMDSKTLTATFPDGSFVMAMLAFGWMWPAIVVVTANNLWRKNDTDD